ncbi:MAG: hypothetical protein ACI841_003238 [Planctomycetota bacterium]|jgi:hypothetical protein
MNFQVGDHVRKNPMTWVRNDFDHWGRGVDVGEVVEPPFEMEEGGLDVRWPGGRCFENEEQLLPADLPVDGSGYDGN